jgi:glycosyltransferase involved in cell wall biosynthesis
MNIIIPHAFEANYTMGFIKGLLANKIDLCVISSDITHRKLIKSKIKAINLRGSMDKDRPIERKLFNLMGYYIKLILFLFKNRGSTIHFSGIFENNIILFDGFFLQLYFILISSRYIYTAHNIVPHNKENSTFYKIIYAVIYKIPDTIVVHTQTMKKELGEKFGVSKKKIKVISIGLNTEIPTTDLTKFSARHRLGINQSDRVILFFGKIDPYKGLDLLIMALDRIIGLTSLKLVIAGWFTNLSYRDKILNAINVSRCKEDIHLNEGFISNEDVEVFFKSADVLALPYKNIYQSGVVFLCFNFGLPIVATDVGSLREFVEEGMGIILKTNDAEGLADALRYFFKNQHYFQHEEIAERAKKYKWEKICKSLVPLYQ